MKHKRIPITVRSLLCCVFAAALLMLCHTAVKVYAGYSGLSTGGGLPAVYIVNDIDVSGKSISEAEKTIKAVLERRQIELCGTNINIGEFTDIHVEFAPEDISIWSYLFNKGSQDAAVTYKINKKKLQTAVRNLHGTKTKDAKIQFFDGKARIVPEVYGNILKVTDRAVEYLEQTLSAGKSPQLEQFYKQPKVVSSDLEKKLQTAKAWNDFELELTADGLPIHTFAIASHIKWNGKRAVVSEKWIKEEIGRLAGELDTYGKTRDFITNSGVNIKVPGGTMGWLLDQEGTEAAVYEAVKNKQSSIELVWSNRGAAMWNPITGNDIGNTYVEVSIGLQKVWYYKNGEAVLESSTVTGLPTEERQTKAGVHHILYMQRDCILRGAAGEWNTFVNFWMPFTLDGQGLHDAGWRRRFGGVIYKTNGSHGCVNLPSDFAAQIYAEVETGTPVIVY